MGACSKGRGMKSLVVAIAALSLVASWPSSGERAWAGASKPDTANTRAVTGNPFFNQSTLPYLFPPFDKIKDSDYRPAFDAGMEEELREVAAIAHNAQTPDFDNT